MIRAALLSAVLLGCWTPVAPKPTRDPAPSNQVQPDQRAQLVHSAERALSLDSPMDLTLPMAEKPRDRSHTVGLLLEACRAGDHPSCWKALAVAQDTDRPAITKLVEGNCVAGDMLSCRALPDTPVGAFSGAPGSMGRSEACDDTESTTCDRKALRTECTAGFPNSCQALMRRSSPEEDRDALMARMFELSAAGCDAWIGPECARLASHDGDLHQQLAMQRSCDLERQCGGAAGVLVSQNQLPLARDLYERSCQYRGVGCERLAVAYLEGKLPEPVKGRGQALIDWWCAGSARVLRKGEKLTERFAECKLATTH